MSTVRAGPGRGLSATRASTWSPTSDRTRLPSGPGGNVPRRHSAWANRSPSVPASLAVSSRSPTSHRCNASRSIGSASAISSSSPGTPTPRRWRRNALHGGAPGTPRDRRGRRRTHGVERFRLFDASGRLPVSVVVGEPAPRRRDAGRRGQGCGKKRRGRVPVPGSPLSTVQAHPVEAERPTLEVSAVERLERMPPNRSASVPGRSWGGPSRWCSTPPRRGSTGSQTWQPTQNPAPWGAGDTSRPGRPAARRRAPPAGGARRSAGRRRCR